MEASASRLLLRPIQSFSHSRNNDLFAIRCGGKKMDTAMKLKTKETKKRLKLMKGLSTDISLFSDMGFSHRSAIEESHGSMLSELSRILMEQVEQRKLEKKQLKRKEKKEKKKAKALKKKFMKRDSDSDSSDSSDSESEEVHVESFKEMNNNTTIAQETANKLESTDVVVASFSERVEVCMGGKCKKFGSETLMKELDGKIGVEGAVVGCKCMGKCKNAPNVRVSSRSEKKSVEGVRNPLYLGVGLEDVDLIVSNFLGKGMAAAAS